MTDSKHAVVSPVAKLTELPNESLRQQQLGELLKVAGDPLRLEVMRVMQQDSFAVQELAEVFAMAQPGMSHHLKRLANVHLLITRRQGNTIFYRRPLLDDTDCFYELRQAIYASVDRMPLSHSRRQKIRDVSAKRAQKSLSFFNKNAKRFAGKKAQPFEANHYLSNIGDLFDLIELDAQTAVMEVGPGQGMVLELLAKRFEQVVALDSSAEMLDITAKKLKAKFDHIEFVHAPIEAYQPGELQFGAIVLNMVLHHTSSPSETFHQLYQRLQDNGYLVVADLGPHNQDWVREMCGDVWLGFEPQEITEWAVSAGFEERQALYLGLSNGFQIQLRLFQK